MTDRYVHDARDVVELDPTSRHPLAPPGSPTIAEERAEHNRQLANHDRTSELERRQDHICSVVDTIFVTVSKVLVSVDALRVGQVDIASGQTDTISAVNKLAGRVDGVVNAIGGLERQQALTTEAIGDLRRADAALAGDIRTTESHLSSRVTALELAVAKLVDPPRAKRPTLRRR